MKIRVIADRDTTLAFALAGIAGHTVRDAAEVAAIFRELAGQQVGLVLITEKLAEACRQLLDDLRMTADAPLILAIPDLSGPVETKRGATEQIMNMLRS